MVYTWDATKPATNDLLVSADVRNNFAALGESLHGVNLIADPCFMIWSGSTTCDHWALGGTGGGAAPSGAAIARETGAGNFKLGPGSLKLTGSSAGAAQVRQRLMPVTTAWRDHFRGVPFSFGLWLKASSIGVARPFIYDGVTTTYPTVSGSPVYNGSTSFEFMSVSATLGGSATQLSMGVELASNATPYTLYADMTIGVIGTVLPLLWHPSPTTRGSLLIPYQGTLSGTATFLNGIRFYPSRPLIVLNTRVSLGAISSGTVTVDVNKNNTSMYGGTKPNTTTAAPTDRAPDGTYTDRCLSRSDYLSVDMDGAGTSASDLVVLVDVLQWQRPLEFLLGATEVN